MLRHKVKKAAAFVVRYVWGGLCCLYLFRFGWVFARNRGFLYQICAHFRHLPRPRVDDRQKPATTKADQAVRLLADLPGIYWHQRFEIAPGVFTPGHKDIAYVCRLSQIPSDLSGKSILDIGACNGGFSFEMEKRGARVTAVDVVPDDRFGFQAIAHFLGSRVEYRTLSVYDLDPEDLGTFDIVLFMGVIYHLRHPLFALDKIWAVTRECCYLESQVIDGGLAAPSGIGGLDEFGAAFAQLPIVEFHRFDELNKDFSNWFSPTRAALEAWLWSTGFEPELTASWPSDKPDRCVFRAKKRTGTPEWLRIPYVRPPQTPSPRQLKR